MWGGLNIYYSNPNFHHRKLMTDIQLMVEMKRSPLRLRSAIANPFLSVKAI
jgi:hypothetical protein